jgi:ferric-dicitrate binding protein FerR (iron transport regulator)
MVFMVPIMIIVAAFTFAAIMHWINTQRQEREAFYKAESLRRITEASAEGAKAALELMREESRMERIKKHEGLKLGGLICVGVGAAMVIFLRAMAASEPDVPYLVGLIPGFVGVALLVYVYMLAGKYE